jgi:hypothetical protein
MSDALHNLIRELRADLRLVREELRLCRAELEAVRQGKSVAPTASRSNRQGAEQRVRTWLEDQD